MNRFILSLIVLAGISGPRPILGGSTPDEYSEKIIPHKVLHEQRVTRADSDRVYSYQLTSKKALKKFLLDYNVSFSANDVKIQVWPIIACLNDDISDRVKSFVVPSYGAPYIDVYETNVRYRLAAPGKGKKYSYLTIVALEAGGKYPHVRLKGFKKGLSARK